MPSYGLIHNNSVVDKTIITRQDIVTAAIITALDSSKGFVRLTGATATELQGIVAGEDGQNLAIYNSSSAIITFKHQNGSALAANRIITESGNDELLSPNGTANLVYDGNAQRWILEAAQESSTDATYVEQSGAAGFTRTSTSTVTVTNNSINQTIFFAGLPVRYKENASDVWLYGIIKSYVAGVVTIGGIPLPTTLYGFQVGPANYVSNIPLLVSGNLTVGDDKLKTAMKTNFTWRLSEAYFIYAIGVVDTAANGADLHIMLAKNSAVTNLLTAVLNLAQATTPVDTGIAIDSNIYRFLFGDKFFINVDQIGSVIAGSDLTVLAAFVFPDVAIIIYYGFFGGGTDGSGNSNIIDYINFALITGNAIDRGDLTVSRPVLAGVGGNAYGFYGGGGSTGVHLDVIDYINLFLTIGNAIDRGDLTIARQAPTGVSGSAYGFYGGGYTGTYSNVIDYIDLSLTIGNAIDRGDLIVARRNAAGVSGSVYGFYGGGYAGTYSDIIDYIDLSLTIGNAIDRGDLTIARDALAGV